MDRYLQVWLAVFLAVLVFVILVHPAIDLPDGAVPQKHLAGIVILCLLVLATASIGQISLTNWRPFGSHAKLGNTESAWNADSTLALRC